MIVETGTSRSTLLGSAHLTLPGARDPGNRRRNPDPEPRCSRPRGHPTRLNLGLVDTILLGRDQPRLDFAEDIEDGIQPGVDHSTFAAPRPSASETAEIAMLSDLIVVEIDQ